jgi:oligogalacturonide lyase
VSPDGSQILYTTDARGYGNPHLVDIPEFDSLPPLEDDAA